MKVYTEINFLTNISFFISEAIDKNENLLLELLKLKNFLKSNDIKEIILLDKNNALVYPEELREYISRKDARNLSSKEELVKIENINFSYPFCYFFLLNNNEAITEKNKIQLNLDSLEKDCENLFSDMSKNPKVDFNNWTNFTNCFKILPTNSIIVCDNFLFKNKQHNIKELLKKLLLNSNYRNEIDITLICGQEYTYDELKRHWDSIYDILQKDLKIKKFNLCVVKKLNKDYHDRHIFTDYQVFESGNSFSMYFNVGRQSFVFLRPA